jgi:uncharacterized protein (TIGR03435 family)
MTNCRANLVRHACVVALVSGALLHAQQPAFSAASVKPVTGNGAGRADFILVRPGQLLAQYATLRELIQAAYGVEQNQVVDGPSWLDGSHFEVNAAIPDGTAIDDVQTMLQSLLRERFGLVTRREQRNLPVYLLESLGRPGSRLWTPGPECRPVAPPAGVPMPPPPPPPPAGAVMTILNQPRLGGGCPSMFFTGHMSARNVPLSLLVFQLSRMLRRQVLDRTALAGRYDFDLTFTPDAGAAQFVNAGVTGGGPGGPPPTPTAEAPALTTALREQLGLKLESTRAPVDVVAIEQVTALTAN